MLSFIAAPVPLRRTKSSALNWSSHERKASTTHTPKRWRMMTNDRSTEFSLNSTPDPLDPTATDITEAVDWDDWYASGKPMTIPAMPFPPVQVFMPGELKQLHLFEARYLALFESIVVHYDKKCAHVLIDSARKAMAAFGTTIAVKSWRRLEVGVSVDFEGVGRLKTARMKSSAPFLRGDFEVVEDDPMSKADLEAAQKLEKRFWNAFHEVIAMCVKLGEDPIRKKIDTASATIEMTEASKDSVREPEPRTLAGEDNMYMPPPDAKRELFKQKLKEAARRAVNHQEIDFLTDDAGDEMLTRRAYALSFAGWDFFPSQPGMRQKAIEQRNTISRLSTVVDNLEEHCRKLAAKLALQEALSK